MSNYRRALSPGGCYFFTLVTYKRFKYFANEKNVSLLRKAFRHVKHKYPFEIDAIVILPDHIHTIWHLPENDSNFSLRWRLIKHYVSTHIDNPINQRKEKAIWQRRFWEHVICDEYDWRNHMDYIHYNPVKHGYTDHPKNWKYSSYSRALIKGWYDNSWGYSEPLNIQTIELE